MRRPGAAAGALPPAILLLAAGQAQAHAFAMRYDLPLPLWHYLVGAGAAVALSFAVAAWFLRVPPKAAPALRLALPARPVALALALFRAVALALFAVVVAAGLLGRQGDWDTNILPVVVWVLWWVGFAFVAALLFDPWALVNPLVTVARCARALRGGCAAPRFRLPEAAGVWPAVALCLGFAWAELVWPSNAVPARLACAVLLYAAITWAGMAAFGIEAWRDRGEAFALFFALFARFAPLAAERGADGRPVLVVRPWGAGLAGGGVRSASETAFVVVVLAHVSFDGIAETPFWLDLSGAAMGLLYRAGLVHLLGFVAAQSLVKTAGLLATPVAFFLVYRAVAQVIARIEGAPGRRVARAFVLSLVPIAIAYHLAHYLSYLLIQGQMLLPLASDPFALGWDLLGTRARGLDIGLVDARMVWITAVTAIVAGHVAAVLLAHGEALARVPSPRRAVSSQLPMLALMVAYTMLSLWILSQPIVEG